MSGPLADSLRRLPRTRTSVVRRAIRSAWLTAEEMDLMLLPFIPDPHPSGAHGRAVRPTQPQSASRAALPLAQHPARLLRLSAAPVPARRTDAPRSPADAP